jgi:hypothetical protein
MAEPKTAAGLGFRKTGTTEQLGVAEVAPKTEPAGEQKAAELHRVPQRAGMSTILPLQPATKGKPSR